MQINSTRYGLITLASIQAENISGLLLPGSNTMYCEREFGSILIQEYRADYFSIRYFIFNFLKKMTLFFNEEKPGVISRLALKNSIRFKKISATKINRPKSPRRFSPCAPAAGSVM